jgi:hypothetical protein
VIGLAQGLAGAKQGLGRHAASVRALAPDQLSFDHRERQPAAIASPAAPPPRHTTSHSWDNLPISVTACDRMLAEVRVVHWTLVSVAACVGRRAAVNIRVHTNV